MSPAFYRGVVTLYSRVTDRVLPGQFTRVVEANLGPDNYCPVCGATDDQRCTAEDWGVDPRPEIVTIWGYVHAQRRPTSEGSPLPPPEPPVPVVPGPARRIVKQP